MRVPGLSNWRVRSKLQQFRFKVCQAECNRCDNTGNPWAFVFSFRTEFFCASRQRSYVPTPPPHNRRLFLDFGAIFSEVTLNFWVKMIRQVIFPSSTAANWVSFDFNVSYSSCWGYSLINTLKLKKKIPSPCTISTHHFEPERGWKGEGAGRSRWLLGRDCLPARLLPLHPAKFVGRAFLHPAGAYFHPRICLCATFSLAACG